MSSIPLRTRIENNIALWMLGTLLAGFTAGYATRAEIVSVSGQVVVSAERLARLEETERTYKEERAAHQTDRAEPARNSFESTTSGAQSPVINTVEPGK